MKNKTTPIIVCPKCGREYLPGEIYIPKYFVGQPTDITKDISGKLIDYDQPMLLDEEYICDNCNTPLSIHARVSFDVSVNTDKDFDSDYSTVLYNKDRIKLGED